MNDVAVQKCGVFLEDEDFQGVALSEILRRCTCDAVRAPSVDDLGPWLESMPEGPDVLILPFRAGEPWTQPLRAARQSPRGRRTPILAVAHLAQLDLDLAWLRASGVVGLVEPETDPSLVEQRLKQIVRPERERRAHDRVQCFLAVEVEYEEQKATEHALSLSEGGMRLATSRELPLNAVLDLRFRLPVVSEAPLEVAARVVNRAPLANSQGAHEVGVFFFPLGSSTKRVIRSEVERLLSR